jgi:HD superfamily phosphohydrolase
MKKPFSREAISQLSIPTRITTPFLWNKYKEVFKIPLYNLIEMKRQFWGFIKDPLYGYIKITDLEKEVIDTRPVQRLRRIKQLSGSEYVYPAANHTRFEHVLGSMYLAGLMWENLPVEESPEEWQRIRLAALLHDLGHGPFSHVFDPILIKHIGKTHEDLTSWLIKESEVGDVIEAHGFSKIGLSMLAVGKLTEDRPFKNQMIAGAVDVDKLDFISRDSYHTGAGYGYVDVYRLIYTMDLRDDMLVVDSTALSTLEAFLLARLESFKTIYFHKASRAVQIMLVKALESAMSEFDLLKFQNPDEYLLLDDYWAWSLLKQCPSSRKIVEEIECRRLLKCAYEVTLYTKDKLVSSIFTNESVRGRIEDEIALEANLPREDVVIDVPSLPSVPYSNAASELMDIPILVEREGKKDVRSVGEISRIIDVLRVFMSILRVYTREEHRAKVRKASEKILGSLPSETKISY